MTYWIRGKTKHDKAFIGYNAVYDFYFWTHEQFRAYMFDSETEAFKILKNNNLSSATCYLRPVTDIVIKEWGI